MFNGPGKYDDLLTQAREKSAARGGLLLLLGGHKGGGFSVQMEPDDLRNLPGILEEVARQVRADIAALDIAAMMDSKGQA